MYFWPTESPTYLNRFFLRIIFEFPYKTAARLFKPAYGRVEMIFHVSGRIMFAWRVRRRTRKRVIQTYSRLAWCILPWSTCTNRHGLWSAEPPSLPNFPRIIRLLLYTSTTTNPTTPLLTDSPGFGKKIPALFTYCPGNSRKRGWWTVAVLQKSYAAPWWK
jgi:hypothetical protein